jgi:hypothetical protein
VRGVPAFKPRSVIIEAVILEKLCDAYPSDTGGRPEAGGLGSPEGRRGKAMKPHSPKGFPKGLAGASASRPTIINKAIAILNHQ